MLTFNPVPRWLNGIDTRMVCWIEAYGALESNARNQEADDTNQVDILADDFSLIDGVNLDLLDMID